MEIVLLSVIGIMFLAWAYDRTRLKNELKNVRIMLTRTSYEKFKLEQINETLYSEGWRDALKDPKAIREAYWNRYNKNYKP